MEQLNYDELYIYDLNLEFLKGYDEKEKYPCRI